MAAEQKIEARPRNWLTPVTLVLLREESSYGYEILERLEEEFGFEQIRAGRCIGPLDKRRRKVCLSPSGRPPRVDRPAGYTQLLRVGKNTSQHGRRRVSSTRTLWTVSPEPIQVGRSR
jgi:hypothetical protein